MKATFADRMSHIKQAIVDIRSLTSSSSDAEIAGNAIKRAALERFLEVISEASRYIPDEKRLAYPQIPWKRVAGIGNVIRHGYDTLTIESLLSVARIEIDALERAIDEMIRADQTEPSSR